MALITANCPRCRVKAITLDVLAAVPFPSRYSWQATFEIFAVCRSCRKPSILKIQMDVNHRNLVEQIDGIESLLKYKGDLQPGFEITGYVALSDMLAEPPPEHLPTDIDRIFREASSCRSVRCYNAAATMFRLCLDLATKPMLPSETEDGTGPNKRQRRDLGLRLQWLFDNGRLPGALRDLATCVREDANDGAHVGNLIEADADDLRDFTFELLDRLYTEPRRLEMAAERRAKRRAQP